MSIIRRKLPLEERLMKIKELVDKNGKVSVKEVCRTLFVSPDYAWRLMRWFLDFYDGYEINEVERTLIKK